MRRTPWPAKATKVGTQWVKSWRPKPPGARGPSLGNDPSAGSPTERLLACVGAIHTSFPEASGDRLYLKQRWPDTCAHYHLACGPRTWLRVFQPSWMFPHTGNVAIHKGKASARGVSPEDYTCLESPNQSTKVSADVPERMQCSAYGNLVTTFTSSK